VISKNEIKLIRSLARKRNRLDLGFFPVEGAKMTQEALQSEFVVTVVYYANWDIQERVEHVRYEQISVKEMATISHLTTPSNVLALVKYPERELETEKLAKQKILVLDAIRDPGNLGTIMRSADWFGVTDIVASTDTVDCFNPKVTQATMGSLFRVRVHYTDLDILADIKRISPDFKVYGAMLNGDHPSVLHESSNAGAIVIGNEGRGVSDEVLKWIDQHVTIEKVGEAESLNAAISASILLYEWKASLRS
jgi:TrmH family RNA methyltransferase